MCLEAGEMSDRPINILLVEDNPGDAHLIQFTLAEGDPGRFELTHVSALSEALEYLAESDVDVVLLDLSLPDSHGLDTFVKAHMQAPGVPFVVLTGLADETVAASALREGAQDYLVKGQLDCNLLVRSMRYAIERMRAEEALRQSEERFRRLVEDAADAFLVIDPDVRVVDVNQMACEQFLYPLPARGVPRLTCGSGRYYLRTGHGHGDVQPDGPRSSPDPGGDRPAEGRYQFPYRNTVRAH